MLADSVLVSAKRHMWFNSEELTPPALVDPGLNNISRDLIADALLENFAGPQNFPPQKPEFRTELYNRHATELHDFIGEKSWLIFQLMDINTDFLYLPSAQWAGNEGYEQYKNKVRALKVVNDVAERGVQDTLNYINYARDGDARDKAIICTNHHRQLYEMKNLTKEAINNMNDNLIAP